MKNYTFAILLNLIFLSIACKQEKDPGPDLTTQLVGQYFGEYIISGPGIGSQALTPSPMGVSLVKIQQKNNNTITVTLSIEDGNIQEHQQFDATVIPLDLSKDTLLKPGLKALYQVTATNAGTTHLFLYKDGTVVGGFAYTNSMKQTVGVSFNL